MFSSLVFGSGRCWGSRCQLTFRASCSALTCPPGAPPSSPPGLTDQVSCASVSPSGIADSPQVKLFWLLQVLTDPQWRRCRLLRHFSYRFPSPKNFRHNFCTQNCLKAAESPLGSHSLSKRMEWLAFITIGCDLVTVHTPLQSCLSLWTLPSDFFFLNLYNDEQALLLIGDFNTWKIIDLWICNFSFVFNWHTSSPWNQWWILYCA